MTTDRGFGIKPWPAWQLESPTTLDEMVATAVRLRAQEDEKPKYARVHIGGDLIATFVGNGSIQSNRVYRWDDVEEHWLAMNRALPGSR
jgi:hypothetical protein